MSGPEFWSRVDAVFIAAVELEGDAGARAALVDARCGGDDALLAEVRSLLTAHEQSGGFLAPAPGSARPDPTALGTIVGAYRLTARIGEGGMGDVYRAERADGLFGHAVALKVTRGSVIDPSTAARFATERQILATLQHPHIVTLLDGGTLADGRAYLVMELVDGVPITKVCADRRLGLEERLALFRQVCAAAHYAHRHAIVHRDLKPANVLVTPDGVVKVLDFGVAKLLAAETGDGQTVPGVLPGPLTPNYASPEQLRGLAVTTASDVYALGVLLYELVTGGRPYETTGQPLDRVIDLVVRTEPPRPSSRVPDFATPLPWDRGRLRGDLDAIALKALAKEPEARYASAEQLADDVARFVAGEPVLARKPSALYLLRKLAGRHRVAAVAAGLALTGIVAALGIALWQRQEAERERRLAEARFADVRALANTLIFKIHDAVVPLPGSTPVRKTIMAEALAYLARLQHDSDGDPLLRYELAGAYQRIGLVLGDPQTANLGDREGAITALHQAEQLIARQAQQQDAPLDTIDRYIGIERQLSMLYEITGRQADARAAGEAALQRAEQLYGRDRRLPRARQMLANALFERAWRIGDQTALPIWRRAGELYDGLLADEPNNPQRIRNVALVEKYVGGLLEQSDPPASLDHYRRALALDERRLARQPENPQVRLDTAIDLSNLAVSVETLHDYPQAIALRRRSADIRRALLAADPRNVLVRGRLAFALKALARAEGHAGGLEAALAHAQESVALARQTLADAPDTLNRSELGDALATLAWVEDRRHHREAACGIYREALATYPTTGLKPARHREETARAVAACDGR